MTVIPKLGLVIALSFLPSLFVPSPQVDSSPCLPASDYRTNMLLHYQFVDTTTNPRTSSRRTLLNLPAVPVAQVIAVDDSLLCRRAVTAYNFITAVDSLPPTTAVNLIKYGSTRYIIGDPSHTAGEYRLEAIVDSSFSEVLTVGR